MNAPARFTDSYDVEAIRRDFPILSREVYGKPLVYLDNGASAQKPQAVLDAINHAYTQEYANVHRGLHFLSNAATDAYEKARATVKRFLNARRCRRDRLHQQHHLGDQHSSPMAGACRASARATRSCCRSWSTTPTSCRGISSASGRAPSWSWAPVDELGVFHLDEFEKCLTERTKLVAITQMSNVLGTVTPIKEIVAHRPCARHPGAGRRQPERRAHAGRRAGSRLRFLRLHRPQGLRAERHRRALRPQGDAGGDAARSRAAAR